MTTAPELPAAARSVSVIGIGNPDRGDDAIGAIVADRLAGRVPDGVAVMKRSGNMMNLGDDMAGLDALVCIDAAAPAGRPGRVVRLDLATDTLERDPAYTSSHAFGLADAIALAEALGVAPKRIVVYAIEGACFDGGAPVTPAVAGAAQQVVDQVVAEVDRLRRGSEEERDDA
jgi:hydrogenase maturation protease